MEMENVPSLNLVSLGDSPGAHTNRAGQMFAYASLFFVIVAYPFVDGSSGERRFYRYLLTMVVITGVAVAAVGLVSGFIGTANFMDVCPEWTGNPFPRVLFHGRPVHL